MKYYLKNIWIRNGIILICLFMMLTLIARCTRTESDTKMMRIKYNHPGLVVDLGVGLWAWAIPTDYDGDGDFDLLVSCPDKPYNGIYFFENTDGEVKMPVFKPPVKIGQAIRNIQPSYIGDRLRLLVPAHEIIDLKTGKLDRIFPEEKLAAMGERIRANQWKYCDFDGDDDLDLIVGAGDWTDYGWDDAFDSTGKWTRGPLHGYVFLIRNIGDGEKSAYSAPEQLKTAGEPIDVYGMPSPNLADFDGDGDLDLVCGEFLDKFTYFENIGTRNAPSFAAGKFLSYEGEPIRMDLEMIVPVAFDWDRDGDIDLIVGQEDGRVAFIEHTGKIVNGMPQFELPRFFRQIADEVKFGALVTPFSFDWDGDGDEDLICGNTAGYIGFIENLDGADPPKWAAPVLLRANKQPIRIQAGYNGSIQGPCEAKWGYTTLNVADWDQDEAPDIIINSIRGEVLWYRNIGTRANPEFAAAQPIRVEWQGKAPKPAWVWWEPRGNQLVTQWRTTPVVFDWNDDGLQDLIMLDHEGYLAFFERIVLHGELKLLPGKRIFLDQNRKPLQLNPKTAGKSGRRKFCIVDWDQDGQRDLLINSRNINFLRNVGTSDQTAMFRDMGEVDTRLLAGHTTSPTVVDWDKNGIPDLLVGAEDGFLYYMKNPNR